MGMERRWLLTLCVGLLFCVGLVTCDAGVEEEVGAGGDKFAPLIKEIERLKSQVGALESSLEKKEAHLGVVEKELTVLKDQRTHGDEKEALSKLEKELDSMGIKVKQLEDQVVAANKQSEQGHKYAQALKVRAENAEESVRDLAAKYEKSQASFLASKKHAAGVEKELRSAELGISEAEKRLKIHGEELSRVHNQWLPPWAASQFAILKTRASTKWSTHAKPQVDALYRHASAKAVDAHAFLKPHLDSVVSKVGPEVQKHWKTVTDSVGPQVELVRSKTFKGYDVFRKEYIGKAQGFLEPHFKTVVETSRPYVTRVQEQTRPYVDHISTASKPYIEHTKNFVNPYVEKASPYYRDAISGALKQHENIQEVVRQSLSKNELAASFITQELVWFIASAVLALPVFLVFLILSALFGAKKKTSSEKAKKVSPPGSSASSGVTGGKHKRSKKADK